MDQLRHTFNYFAENEAKSSSPLYYFWCKEIVTDDEMLLFISKIGASQPKPNLFFASVHYLLFQKEHLLKEYIPSITSNPRPIKQSYSVLKDFVKTFAVELEHCFQTKLVQTNEVRRSAYLYPIFSEIAEKVQKPLTLIEIGTSAGLLLNVDQYRYEIKQGNEIISYGNPNSEVCIQSENLGRSITSCSSFEVSGRYGIDLNIIQLVEKDDLLWMNALIWPEHADRRSLFSNATKLNNSLDKSLHEGNMLEILPAIINMASDDNQIVIFHTHVANQFSNELKKSYEQLLLKLSQRKSIFHIYNNMFDSNVHVDLIINSKVDPLYELNKPDGHGRYFYW